MSRPTGGTLGRKILNALRAKTWAMCTLRVSLDRWGRPIVKNDIMSSASYQRLKFCRPRRLSNSKQQIDTFPMKGIHCPGFWAVSNAMAMMKGIHCPGFCAECIMIFLQLQPASRPGRRPRGDGGGSPPPAPNYHSLLLRIGGREEFQRRSTLRKPQWCCSLRV